MKSSSTMELRQKLLLLPPCDSAWKFVKCSYIYDTDDKGGTIKEFNSRASFIVRDLS